MRIVIADDHPIVLEGLRRLFESREGFEVVAACSDGEAALAAVRHYQPTVALLDIRMPGLDGVAIARELAASGAPTRVVLLTAGISEEETVEMMRIGIGGIVLKNTAPETLIDCVRRVAAGERWIDAASSRRALERVLRREAGMAEASRILTARELEIVLKAVGGKRNREIAEELCIAEGTVKVHLHAIYEKLQISGRMELVQYARERALI
jgi:DNA-binding NarL/FixJ family response regulator